jgi:hypothetical protein
VRHLQALIGYLNDDGQLSRAAESRRQLERVLAE